MRILHVTDHTFTCQLADRPVDDYHPCYTAIRRKQCYDSLCEGAVSAGNHFVYIIFYSNFKPESTLRFAKLKHKSRQVFPFHFVQINGKERNSTADRQGSLLYKLMSESMILNFFLQFTLSLSLSLRGPVRVITGCSPWVSI